MSTMAIGASPPSRPGASFFARNIDSTVLQTLEQRLRARLLQRLAAARKARIGHEVGMGVEMFLALGGDYALARSVGQDPVGLLVVDQIGDHDLVENLLVDGRIEDRQHDLDAAVEIA